MDASYDAIVLGTGLKECIISGLLSVDGLKVSMLESRPTSVDDRICDVYHQRFSLHVRHPEFCAGFAHRPQQLLRWSVRIAEPQSGIRQTKWLIALKSLMRAADFACTYLQLYERFRPGQKPPTKLGSSRDYNVDMVPKFIMAGGVLVRVLVHTGKATCTEQIAQSNLHRATWTEQLVQSKEISLYSMSSICSLDGDSLSCLEIYSAEHNMTDSCG